ncbi:hypothetical protein [Rubripirellula tenax]|uniref:hypothetical protein n=1 Tax=Rubripirellula tenax TaxID=2528015 RepID=UPI0011B3F3AF|nr:hypothetical protein [Rubripirellula tenax]
MRDSNAKNHPGVFDTEPPTNLDPSDTDLVDLYDCGSCVYLGRLNASIVSDLISATSDMPDQGPNDIFVIEETLEPPLMPEAVELKAFLREHFDTRGYAILRWFPAQKSK